MPCSSKKQPPICKTIADTTTTTTTAATTATIATTATTAAGKPPLKYTLLIAPTIKRDWDGRLFLGKAAECFVPRLELTNFHSVGASQGELAYGCIRLNIERVA